MLLGILAKNELHLDHDMFGVICELTAAFLCDISISMSSTKAKTEEKNRKTISKSMSAPCYSGVATFMRTDLVHDPSGLDIVLIGVPYDGAVESRSGARHGPREVRNMSSMMQAIHHMTRINPYQLCEIADIGDVPFTNVYKFEEVHNDIANFFQKVHKAGVVPLSVVEVSPPFDPSGNTALVAATIMYEILCLLAESLAHRKKK